MPSRSIPYPFPNPEDKEAPDPFDGNPRYKKYRKIPLVLAGLFKNMFRKSKVRKNINRLLEILTPTSRGTYRLFADKIQELYPERADSPQGLPTHLKTYLKTIKDAKFIWAHAFQLGDPKIYKALHEKAESGIPVYLVVGEKDWSKKSLDYFKARKSKVKFVTSATEYQGDSRKHRIDHNKTLFTINSKDVVEIIEGLSLIHI